MKYKPRIFIGSSKESLYIAERVQQNFQKEYICEIWNNNFFEINKNTYDNLVKNSIAFDYAIFIGGKDDKVTRLKKGTKKIAPRDNVYLELGLYAGILSPARSFFLIDNKCKVASDFDGITLLYYSTLNDIDNCCANLKNKIESENRINRIQLLPSTSLAIGYFENFLKPVGEALRNLEKIEFEQKIYNISRCDISIEIIIPKNIETDWQTWAKEFFKSQKVKKVGLEGTIRNIGVLIDCDALEKENKILIYDVPLTMKAALKSVDLVMGVDFIGTTTTLLKAKQKEVNNFVKTLKNLSKTDSLIKESIVFREE